MADKSAFADRITNMFTAVTCFLVISLVAPQLKDRWLDRRQPSRSRVEQVNDLHLALPSSDSMRGSQNAKVALIEYSDFQCPFCGAFARDTAPSILTQFVETGKIRYAFRNYPLTQVHRLAMKASIAALCAGDQHRFWPMHDKLFANQSALDLPDLRAYGAEVGLDDTAFSKCLDTRTTSDDIENATRLGVTSTPTFVLGTIQPSGIVVAKTKIQGAQPLSVYQAAIEDLLRSVNRS